MCDFIEENKVLATYVLKGGASDLLAAYVLKESASHLIER